MTGIVVVEDRQDSRTEVVQDMDEEFTICIDEVRAIGLGEGGTEKSSSLLPKVSHGK